MRATSRGTRVVELQEGVAVVRGDGWSWFRILASLALVMCVVLLALIGYGVALNGRYKIVTVGQEGALVLDQWRARVKRCAPSPIDCRL